MGYINKRLQVISNKQSYTKKPNEEDLQFSSSEYN